MGKEYASTLVATCRYCGAGVGELCESTSPCIENSHESRWRDAQGVEIAALRKLLQEATEGQECHEHYGKQETCSCGAAICPEPARCLLGRVDRRLGHRAEGACQA